jgi:membrane protein YqaA with SNARE-associated domain
MPPEAKVAVRVYWGAVIAMIVLASIGNVLGEIIPMWWKIGAWISTLTVLVGQLLCWRAGWKRYNSESAPFAGKHIDKFVVYVLFSPIGLCFSDITFPKWGF